MQPERPRAGHIVMKMIVAFALLATAGSAHALQASVPVVPAETDAAPRTAGSLSIIDGLITSDGPIDHAGDPNPPPAFPVPVVMAVAEPLVPVVVPRVPDPQRLAWRARTPVVKYATGTTIATGDVGPPLPTLSADVMSIAATGGAFALGLIGFTWARRRFAPAAVTHRRVAVDARDFVRAVAEPSIVQLDIQTATSDFPSMRDAGTSSATRNQWTAAEPREARERINYHVAEYRLYRLNITGIVDTAESGLFANDGEALAHARVFGEGQAVEVWQGSREVAVVPGRVLEATEATGSADYRFHRLDETGSVRMTFRQRLQNDAEAMLHAITLSQGDSIDVWSPLRRLGTVRSGPLGTAN